MEQCFVSLLVMNIKLSRDELFQIRAVVAFWSESSEAAFETALAVLTKDDACEVIAVKSSVAQIINMHLETIILEGIPSHVPLEFNSYPESHLSHL